jgi:hypothetical protein
MKRSLILIFFWLAVSHLAAQPQVAWLDGTRAEPPQGLLLTPNADYWGESLATGVTYRHETAPTGKADGPDDDPAFAGRRLFDGVDSGWYARPEGPVLQMPAAIVFDFGRTCTFTELDLLSELKPVRFQVEVSADQAAWSTVYDATERRSAPTALRRLPLTGGGRYLRLRADAEGTLTLTEVWVWGSAERSEPDYAQAGMRSTLDLAATTGVPGLPATRVTDADYTRWLGELEAGNAAQRPAVWSPAAPWQGLATSPVLPERARINQPLTAVVCRNEAEPLAAYLTNTSRTEVRTLKLELSAFVDAAGNKAPGLSGELHAFAIQTSKAFGPTPYALISARNKPGRDVLRRHCLNAAQIMDFPTVRLPPAGTALLWVKLRTDNCPPGTYTAVLSGAADVAVTLKVEVADVTLPYPKVWVNYWTNETNMAPFRPLDWVDREARVRHELGMTVVDGWPEPGSGAAALYKLNPQTLFKIWGMGDYGHKLWAAGHMDAKFGVADFTPAMRTELKGIVAAHVAKARTLGLGYEQWFIESGDEPNPKCLALFGEMARTCKEADPKVMIYANPCGWLGLPDKVVEDDATMFPPMQDWYAQCIDISVPGFLNLDGQPNSYTLYTAPRPYNALYDVLGGKARSNTEYRLINYPRYLAWLAIRHGFNGWAYYSIYQTRGQPWDDNDQPEGDYLTLFPGPQGPVITRGAEASGEASEDFRLLSLLRERRPEVHARLVQECLATGDYDAARTRAIQALVDR